MPHDETTAQSTIGVPPPDPELQRLAPLLGTWSCEDHTNDTVLGRGVPVTSVESFSWLEGGYFLVHTYETVFGDEPAQKGVNYCGYDTDARKFRIVFFSNNGPFTEHGNRYEGEVADGRLTFVGPARFEYRLDDTGRIKVDPDGTIFGRLVARGDGGAWQPWMTNTFRKLRD